MGKSKTACQTMMKQEKKKQVLELRKRGLRYSAIAMDVGVSKTTVYNWLLEAKQEFVGQNSILSRELLAADLGRLERLQEEIDELLLDFRIAREEGKQNNADGHPDNRALSPPFDLRSKRLGSIVEQQTRLSIAKAKLLTVYKPHMYSHEQICEQWQVIGSVIASVVSEEDRMKIIRKLEELRNREENGVMVYWQDQTISTTM